MNWTRQLSCQVINSLRKFSALSQAKLNTAIWIDKQSPVCTKCLLDSFVSQHPLPSLDNTPARLRTPPRITLFSFQPFHSLTSPSFLSSLAFTHWSLCHFLNNDPGAARTTAYLYFITVRPSPADLGDQAVQRRGWEMEQLKESERGRGLVAHGKGGRQGGSWAAAMSWLTAQMSPPELNLRTSVMSSWQICGEHKPVKSSWNCYLHQF